MNAIVVVDSKWGIGKDNDLLFSLPKDMAFFKQMTTDKVIIVGANTFASFPRGALPNRVNVVLDNSGNTHSGAITVSTVAGVENFVEQYNTDDVFICGGASVYALFIDKCRYAYVTKVSSDGNAEVFFPNLDTHPNWQLIKESEPIQDGEYEIRFCKYLNNFIT